AYFTYNFTNYALTATETALLLERSEANTPYNINNNGFCVSCISNLTHLNLPYSIYISSSHLGLTGESPNASSYVESSDITGNSGLGIGVFWLDDFLNGGHGGDDEEPGTCDPVSSNPGTCGTTGTYIDSDDWTNCVYNWDVALVGASKWCNIYCREEVTTNFPGDIQTAVKAGNHFIWEPISVSGTKVCKTTGLTSSNAQTSDNLIDLERWLKEWNYLNDRIPVLYDAWQIAEEQETIIDDALSDGRETKSCGCKSGHRVSVACSTPGQTGCTKFVCDVYYDKYYTDTVSYDGTTTYRGNTLYKYDGYYFDGSTIQKSSIQVDDWCEDDREPDPDVSEKKQAYLEAIERRDELEAALKRCNNWMSDITYNLDTDVTINYEYLGYTYNITLDKNVNEQRITNYCIDGKCSTNSLLSNVKLTKKACSGEGCYLSPISTTIIMPYNNLISLTVQKEIKYTLPTDTFRYVLKSTDESVSTKPTSSYIDIGYGNLPVHYTTLAGIKDISLTYSNVGEDYHFDDLLDTNVYRCTYTVFSGITTCNPDIEDCGDSTSCDPDVEDCNPGPDKANEMNVIYRTISLDNPFPANDGEGRVPGNNWLPDSTNRLSYTAASYPIDVVSKYITNNRGVTTTEVYDKEPMYEIELNTVRIKAIRDYNDTTDYDDFNLTCEEGTGRECISKFIHETFYDYFVAGIDGSDTSTCGLSSDFYACNESDGITR
ncbi:MAG: hypothetical protein PHE54_04235, partial [Bacilli bacterium]|nr:hypothetical protein [Bacilli bacterium]